MNSNENKQFLGFDKAGEKIYSSNITEFLSNITKVVYTNEEQKEDLFVDMIKKVDPSACQKWRDNRRWYLKGNTKYKLQVWIRSGKAYVSPHGRGDCEELIANTPEELKECILIWWRNRYK